MTKQTDSKKILYAASTASHLKNFHAPYIAALRREHTVLTMARGEGVDLPIDFAKSFFSLSNLRALFRIRRILKRERFDVLILHTSLAAFLVRAAMIGWRRRPFVLNVVHGYLFQKNARGKRDRLLLFCERLMRKKTDEIVVMNQEDLEIARQYKLCRGSVTMIDGMGIIIPEGTPEKEPSIRERYAIDKDDFLCCFVGELSRRKNQSFLISAVSRLWCREGVPIRLLLIGDGAMHAELEKQIQNMGLESRVKLCGSQDDVRAHLSSVDLYVSASVSEGLPFNVMEAMSCGLPIVASDVKGQHDLLCGTDAVLYPLDDLDAFCAAVCRIYESRSFGAGTVAYPDVEKYRLGAVFEKNMRVLKGGWESI